MAIQQCTALGEISAGTWTLEVYDDGNQDEGIWNHWELVIHGIS